MDPEKSEDKRRLSTALWRQKSWPAACRSSLLGGRGTWLNNTVEATSNSTIKSVVNNDDAGHFMHHCRQHHHYQR